jgi:uncharacterized caspase-like protein
MAGNDWAIAIGINTYEFLPPADHLKYAVHDAVKVRQFLCEQAKFPQENVLLCCDLAPGVSPQQRPSRNGLRHLLKNEIQRAKGANNFWFFYAGHGVVHEHQDFLLPYDGNPNDLRDTAIPISFVTDCLRECGAEQVVLVLDMCRNRTRGADEGSRGIGEVMGEQTQQIAQAQGIVTLFSCSRGERSYEIGDLGQGAFTYALLAGLQQSTTPRALEHYLTNQLPALNHQYGKPIQTPRVIPEPGWKYDRPLLLSCATPTDIHHLAVAARDAELEEQDYEQAKALWWQVIEADRSTPSDRAQARKAIDRINNSIAEELERQRALDQQRRPASVPKSPSPTNRSNQPPASVTLARRQFLKWAIPAGVGVVGVTVSQFLRQQLQQPSPPPTPSPSGTTVDYSKLEGFLKAGKWREADQATAALMLQVANREQARYLDATSIQNFPCEVLREIDRLWVVSSEGIFGFSVQKKIYVESCGGKPDGKYDGKAMTCFGDRVGWRVKDNWIPYDVVVTFNTKEPEGRLPLRIVGDGEGWGIFSLTAACKL